jgi:aspartate ammonia-lyase
VRVPAAALHGAQTQRAIENFRISSHRLADFPTFVRALALVKLAAVRANRRLDLIDEARAAAIGRACEEIAEGRWLEHFAVDMVQGGAGTSTNMNANEVIANRALELLGHARGEVAHLHPNNHVNLSQSTNDVYPSAIRLALLLACAPLHREMDALRSAWRAKAAAFAGVVKMGRTQLQEAVPMTLGQEFNAFAVMLGEDMQRLAEAADLLRELNLGGTAIGTGLNAPAGYPEIVVAELAAASGERLVVAADLIEATADTGAFVTFSAALKRAAVKLSKVCNDLRLLASGPRAGFAEIVLPAMQPGSSIMPGKVNPVIPEVVNQVAFQVIGNDLAVTLACEAGQLQLNAFEPIVVLNLLLSIDWLTAACRTLRVHCVEGIQARPERCREAVLNSIGLATALNPVIGYEASARVAQESLRTGRSVPALVIELGLLDEAALTALLQPQRLASPHGPRSA